LDDFGGMGVIGLPPNIQCGVGGNTLFQKSRVEIEILIWNTWVLRDITPFPIFLLIDLL